MPTIWKLVSVKVTQEEFDELIGLRSQFPPFTLDNCDNDFLRRCKMSTTHEGCIVFCMADGREPDIYEIEEITADVRPTFKGIPPKKYSFAAGSKEPFVPGTVVVQKCGFQYCVNQQHLDAVGRTRNQFVQ